MIRQKFLYVIISLLFLFSFTRCDDTVTANDIDNRKIPDSNVSFKQHIAPVFDLKCNSCHGNGKTDAGLNLTNPSFFVDGRIVVPTLPDNSVLVWRIEGRPPDPIMPPPTYAIPLTVDQVRGVKTWIAEGAKNN